MGCAVKVCLRKTTFFKKVLQIGKKEGFRRWCSRKLSPSKVLTFFLFIPKISLTLKTPEGHLNGNINLFEVYSSVIQYTQNSTWLSPLLCSWPFLYMKPVAISQLLLIPLVPNHQKPLICCHYGHVSSGYCLQMDEYNTQSPVRLLPRTVILRRNCLLA